MQYLRGRLATQLGSYHCKLSLLRRYGNIRLSPSEGASKNRNQVPLIRIFYFFSAPPSLGYQSDISILPHPARTAGLVRERREVGHRRPPGARPGRQHAEVLPREGSVQIAWLCTNM